MSQRILLRFNIPNQRGKKTHCQICNVKFQLLVKQEHQCKRCLRCVCEQCGPERRTVYDADGSSSPHRCCLVCIKQIDEINQYKSRHKLCFGQDSEFVSEWTNRLNKQKISYDQILNQYSDNITSVTNENTIRFKRQSQAMLRDLTQGYNYSLRHFIKVVTEGINQIMFDAKVKNVVLAIFARIKSLPYIPQLIYLSVFFLCFANEAHSYFIITRMIQKIYPQYVRVNKMQKDNLLASTLKTILEMYRICVGKVDRNQLEVIAQYLETRFGFFVFSFTLNVSSMPCSFFIINQMLKTGSSVPFLKGIAAMVSLCREDVASYKYFSEVQIPILRTVNVQKLRNCFIQFEKSDAKFEVTNEVFDSVQHRKLHEKYKQLYSLYTKSQKSLNQKQGKIKQILSELGLKKKHLDIQTDKNRKLQSDILKLSSSLPKLLKYEQMSQLYEKTLARNQRLQQKCGQLQKINEKLQKDKAMSDKIKRNWVKLQDEYTQQIVKLKTKNEIMEIQVSAKQIDFNTSFIERRFEQKNVQLNMLNQQLKHTKNQLQFYKLKAIQKSYSKQPKQAKAVQSSIQKQREKQFQKHIHNSKQLVDSLTKEANQLRNQLEQAKAKIILLESKNQRLEDKIKEIQEIRKIVQEIPEEYNYVEAIQQVQRLVQKQTNFIKKKTLESVKDSLIKCYRQLRFRSIDCRIKQDRIKNSFLVNLLNPDNITNIEGLDKEKQAEGNENLFAILENIDQSKLDERNKQCSVM